jgi:hypothetical protein
MSAPIPLIARGALAAALEPLTRDFAGEKAAGDDAPPVHPAEMLGMLLDMGACMDLNSRLVDLEKDNKTRGVRTRAARCEAPASSQQLPQQIAQELVEEIPKLREELKVQLDTLESTLERFLGQLSRRTSPLSDASELFEILSQNGVPATRRTAKVRAAARSASSAYHAALTGATERSRSAFVGVRRDLRARLAALGEAATQIERLDALLTWGTHQQRNELFERLSAPMDEHFRAGLAAALEVLPESASAEDLQPWFEAQGWVESHRLRCEALVRGVFLHERRAIVGVAEAAVEAAIRDITTPSESGHEELSNA